LDIVRSAFAALIAAVAVYHLFLLSNGTSNCSRRKCWGKAFDNMLVHLLRGEATVDHEAIDFEASTFADYAYFGVFRRCCASPPCLCRHAQVPLARLSCRTTVIVYVAVLLRILLIIHQSLPPQNRLHGQIARAEGATSEGGAHKDEVEGCGNCRRPEYRLVGNREAEPSL